MKFWSKTQLAASNTEGEVTVGLGSVQSLGFVLFKSNVCNYQVLFSFFLGIATVMSIIYYLDNILFLILIIYYYITL